MKLVKSYIVDESGRIMDVVLDYKSFLKIEGLMLDVGLGRAMDEALNDEEFDLEEAKSIIGLTHESEV
jgi:hypothetical protein